MNENERIALGDLFKYKKIDPKVNKDEFYIYKALLSPKLWFADVNTLNDPNEIFLYHKDNLISLDFLDKIFVNQKIKNMTKILSLTDSADNLLLWSYYCNGLDGISIGFEKECLDKCFSRDNRINRQGKVNYIGSKSNVNEFDLFFTKSLEWEHENEFRYIGTSDSPFEVPVEICAVKSLTLGKRLIEKNPKFCALISFICERKNIKLAMAEPSLDTFEIKINPTSYDFYYDRVKTQLNNPMLESDLEKRFRDIEKLLDAQ